MKNNQSNLLTVRLIVRKIRYSVIIDRGGKMLSKRSDAALRVLDSASCLHSNLKFNRLGARTLF